MHIWRWYAEVEMQGYGKEVCDQSEWSVNGMEMSTNFDWICDL